MVWRIGSAESLLGLRLQRQPYSSIPFRLPTFAAAHLVPRRIPPMASSASSSSSSSPSSFSSSSSQPQVIVLAGATSVGKSAVARILCKQLDAEIVIADSVQIYRHLTIGSTKPSIEEQQEIPHHLVDICEPNEDFTSGDFARRAADAIQDIISRGKVPVVVGGNTMWVQWLIHGVPDAPKADHSVTAEADRLLAPLERAGDWAKGLQLVATYDPSNRAEKLPRNDWYRLKRCLEVALSLSASSASDGQGSEGRDSQGRDGQGSDGTVLGSVREDDDDDRTSAGSTEGTVRVLDGRRVSMLPAGVDVRCFFLCEEREELYRSIDKRCEELISAGLFSEVTDLIIKNILGPDSMGAKAIGYRQTIKYLCRKGWKSGDAKALLGFMSEFTAATRNYSKRQLKWYRGDSAFLWLEIFRSRPPTALTAANPCVVVDASTELPVVDVFNPHLQVVKEILYWCSRPISEVQSSIKYQMLAGEAVTSIRDYMRTSKRRRGGSSGADGRLGVGVRAQPEESTEQVVLAANSGEARGGGGGEGGEEDGKVRTEGGGEDMDRRVISRVSSPSRDPTGDEKSSEANRDREIQYFQEVAWKSLVSRGELKSQSDVALKRRIFSSLKSDVQDRLTLTTTTTTDIDDPTREFDLFATLDWSAANPIIRSSEGVRPPANLLAYIPHIEMFPDPAMMDSGSGLWTPADAARKYVAKQVNKKKNKAKRKYEATPTDEDADMKDLLASATKFYAMLDHADKCSAQIATERSGAAEEFKDV